MPTTTLKIRYRNPSKPGCVEIKNLMGWIPTQQKLELCQDSANELVLKLLYWKLNSNRTYKRSDCYVIGFDGKEHKLECIEVDGFSYNPSPMEFVNQMVSNVDDCEFKDG